MHVDEDSLGERRLELEDAVGVGLAEELVRLGVVERDLVDVEVDAPVTSAPSAAASSMTVRLDSPSRSIFSSPICDTPFMSYCVTAVPSPAVERCSGTMLASGSEPMTTAAACVDALRQIPSSRLRVVDDVLRPLLVVVELLQLAALLERSLQRDVHHLRHQLGEPVDIREGHVEHASDVADRRPRRHGSEGDDLRDTVASVLLLHVREHAIAPTVVEVDVDVGHLHALAVEEALEDEPVAERLDVGDVEHVAHQRPGGAAAPGPDANAVAACRPDQVPDDQEVRGEPGLTDDVELHVRGARVPRR